MNVGLSIESFQKKDIEYTWVPSGGETSGVERCGNEIVGLIRMGFESPTFGIGAPTIPRRLFGIEVVSKTRLYWGLLKQVKVINVGCMNGERYILKNTVSGRLCTLLEN